MSREDIVYKKLMAKNARGTQVAQDDYIESLVKQGASNEEIMSLLGSKTGPMHQPVYEELQRLPLADQLELQAQPKPNPEDMFQVDGGILEQDGHTFIKPKNIQDLLYPTRKS